MKIILFLFLFLSSTKVFAENPDRESWSKIKAAREKIAREFADVVEPEELFEKQALRALSGYGHLDPNRWVPSNLLANAVLYFDKNKTKFKNQNYISVVDFSPRSNNYRLFIVNLKTGRVQRFRTTHGVGSDVNNDGFAESFGNVPGSRKSSLGYARTAEVYYGAFGRSLRLDGLSSTNSKMRERAVVFHGWEPVVEANVIQPRSYGCVTIDTDFRDGVIDQIKNGSLMLVQLSQ
jgi:L,D-transpeptidase catalytic domain